MTSVANYFREHDLFAKHAGIELVKVGDGTALAKMKIEEHHLNSARVAHGGAIFTLADYAFAAAANSSGKIALSINANINFLRAAPGGTLYAEAREVSLHPKLGTYSITISDEQGELVATFQGIVYRKSDDLPDWQQA